MGNDIALATAPSLPEKPRRIFSYSGFDHSDDFADGRRPILFAWKYEGSEDIFFQIADLGVVPRPDDEGNFSTGSADKDERLWARFLFSSARKTVPVGKIFSCTEALAFLNPPAEDIEFFLRTEDDQAFGPYTQDAFNILSSYMGRRVSIAHENIKAQSEANELKDLFALKGDVKPRAPGGLPLPQEP